MKWALAFALTFGSPQQRPPDRWFALDKWQHFAASAVVQGVAYGYASGRNNHSASLRIGAAAALTVGVGKELADVWRGGPFSTKDLVWDGIGAAAAAGALHAVR